MCDHMTDEQLESLERTFREMPECVEGTRAWNATLALIAQAREANRLREQLADEKRRRVYYQDIVYQVCNHLDRCFGGTTVSGTVNTPSTEVQDRVGELHRRISAAEARADKESRNFDQYLRGLAKYVGCDMAEYDLPSAHGNERLRWAALIALKMEPPAATIAKVVKWLRSGQDNLINTGNRRAIIGAGLAEYLIAKLESGEWAKEATPAKPEQNQT